MTTPGAVEEIQRDIAKRRASIGWRADVLQQRLRPQTLFDELWTELRSDDGRMSLAAAIQRHPVPLVLIGTGLGWFFIERLTGRSLGREERTVLRDSTQPAATPSPRIERARERPAQSW